MHHLKRYSKAKQIKYTNVRMKPYKNIKVIIWTQDKYRPANFFL